MKSLYLNMYKKINYITAVLVLLASLSVNAQVTTQSPYSKYGIGNLKGELLPQFRAMGGISTAINKPTGYNNINMQNPASYAGITMTTIDVGLGGTFTNLSKGSASSNSFNGTLSHLALAFPVTQHSALSFGVIPYSELGYNFSTPQTITGSAGNPSSATVNNVYTGEGGLTKAYIGYGQRFGEHFRIGGNVEYLFGNLIENKAVEFTNDPSAFATRLQNKNSVGGITFSYGAQYDIRLDRKTLLTFGYSGSSPSSVSSMRTYSASKYLYDGTTGEGNVTVETVDSINNAKAKLKLPLIHNFGIALQRDNKWLVGADFRMGNWSAFTIDGAGQGLQNSKGASLGGQITPDITSINSYFKRVDYRLGFSYDQTYIKLADQSVKQAAITFGLGLPLANAMYRGAFYKLNFSTEIGRRGTLTSGSLQENYVSFHIGFALNDTWFKRFKFD